MTKVLYLCNAVEDSVRAKRGIATDAPAATAKVARVSGALKSAGLETMILSHGRGRQPRGKFHPAERSVIGSVPIEYCSFLSGDMLSHVVSVLDSAFRVIQRTATDDIIIFYNAGLHGAAALVAARLLGRKCILDLEDGPHQEKRLSERLVEKALFRLYLMCCRSGVMAASTDLARQAGNPHSIVCYGVAKSAHAACDWTTTFINIHLGGALMWETGVGLLLETLEEMRKQDEPCLQQLRFVVTGQGPLEQDLRRASNCSLKGILDFRGRMSWDDYRAIIETSHVGLCLKLPEFAMGQTTFPSKVIEIASQGRLLLSTRVSDVSKLFQADEALLLQRPDRQGLREALRWIAENRQEAARVAQRGYRKIAALCNPVHVGKELAGFLCKAR